MNEHKRQQQHAESISCGIFYVYFCRFDMRNGSNNNQNSNPFVFSFIYRAWIVIAVLKTKEGENK